MSEIEKAQATRGPAEVYDEVLRSGVVSSVGERGGECRRGGTGPVRARRGLRHGCARLRRRRSRRIRRSGHGAGPQ